MGIVQNWDYMPLAMEEDPDDYRPDSKLAIIIDPSNSEDHYVRELTVFKEKIAPGDKIPLHQHTIAEVLFVDEGEIEVRLGDERNKVTSGAIVFVPAKTPHGFKNIGDRVARIHAVFPAGEISIRYLERNPAPGTEGNNPQAPIAFDIRELIEGNPEEAVRAISKNDFE
ncbi:MAG: cupin domain-containing protein [Balneolaceae bacterium]